MAGPMSTYYEDETITLHHGDSLEVARALHSGSVDCIVTSPPYYGLRDYGEDGQYGAESSPDAYVEAMRALFSELRRVLADDGTLWLNLGDSYGKRKNLLGMPWRVALALQNDGWILRNSIVWSKPNAVPEPVRDRMARRHEQVFLLTKKPRYFFDLDAVRVPYSARVLSRQAYAGRDMQANGWSDAAGRNDGASAKGILGFGHKGMNPKGKNPGDVWEISTRPFRGAHFAVYPPGLAERCILAGCKPGGTVLDPFSGSGTTGMVARENGRKYVGIDISSDYLKLSLETRLQNESSNPGGAA